MKGWRRTITRFIQGLFVTFCAIFGIKVKSFEKQRFVLLKFPHYHQEEVTEDEEEDEEHDSEHLSSDHIGCKGGENAQVLIVSVAGSTLIVGGFPRLDFQRTLITACQECNNLQADLLFITDPFQSFYLKNPSGNWDGGKFYAKKLESISTKYKKVLVVGSSMGATGILHLAGQFPCHVALLFNPLVDLQQESRLMFHVGGLRIPLKLRRVLTSMMSEQFLSPHSCQLIVHISRHSVPDQEQRYILEKLVPSCVLRIVEHDAVEHVLPRWLASTGQLVPLITKTLKDLIDETACNIDDAHSINEISGVS